MTRTSSIRSLFARKKGFNNKPSQEDTGCALQNQQQDIPCLESSITSEETSSGGAALPTTAENPCTLLATTTTATTTHAEQQQLEEVHCLVKEDSVVSLVSWEPLLYSSFQELSIYLRCMLCSADLLYAAGFVTTCSSSGGCIATKELVLALAASLTFWVTESRIQPAVVLATSNKNGVWSNLVWNDGIVTLELLAPMNPRLLFLSSTATLYKLYRKKQLQRQERNILSTKQQQLYLPVSFTPKQDDVIRTVFRILTLPCVAGWVGMILGLVLVQRFHLQQQQQQQQHHDPNAAAAVLHSQEWVLVVALLAGVSVWGNLQMHHGSQQEQEPPPCQQESNESSRILLPYEELVPVVLLPEQQQQQQQHLVPQDVLMVFNKDDFPAPTTSLADRDRTCSADLTCSTCSGTSTMEEQGRNNNNNNNNRRGATPSLWRRVSQKSHRFSSSLAAQRGA